MSVTDAPVRSIVLSNIELAVRQTNGQGVAVRKAVRGLTPEQIRWVKGVLAPGELGILELYL